MEKSIEVLFKEKSKPSTKGLKFFRDKLYDIKINERLEEMSLLELFKLNGNNVINNLSSSNRRVILNSLIQQPHPEKKDYYQSVLEYINKDELLLALTVFDPKELYEYFNSKKSWFYTFKDVQELHEIIKKEYPDYNEKYLKSMTDIIFDKKGEYRNYINNKFGYFRTEEEVSRHKVIFDFLSFMKKEDFFKKWRNINPLTNYYTNRNVSSVHIKTNLFWKYNIPEKYPEFYEYVLKHEKGEELIAQNYLSPTKIADVKGIIAVIDNFENKEKVIKYFKDIEKHIGCRLGCEAFFENQEEEFVISKTELILRIMKCNYNINAKGLSNFIEIIDNELNKESVYRTNLPFSDYTKSFMQTVNFSNRENNKISNETFEYIIKKSKEEKIDTQKEIECILSQWVQNITSKESIQKIKEYANLYELDVGCIFNKNIENIKVDCSLKKEEISEIFDILKKETDKPLTHLVSIDDVYFSSKEDDYEGFGQKLKNITEVFVNMAGNKDNAYYAFFFSDLSDFLKDEQECKMINENRSVIENIFLDEQLPLSVVARIIEKCDEEKTSPFWFNSIIAQKEKQSILNNIEIINNVPLSRKRI